MSRDHIRHTPLDNGLVVLTDTMDTVETASLGIWVDAGARHESPAVNGISHLMEHMAFKGTARRSAQDIAEEIEAVGGHLNAYTSRETTAFYAKVLREHQDVALDILADIVQNAILDPEELERERAVILQEINQVADTPDDIIHDHFQATAFPDQPLGRPVLGSADIVRGLSRDTVQAFLDRHYVAPRMVLSAAGRVDHDTLVAWAAEAFGALPAGGAPEAVPAAYGGGDFREHRDLEQLHLMLGFPGVSYRDEDFYAASVLSTLLGGGMSSRLFQELREKRGLVYTVYSFTSAYTDGGLFGVYAGTGPEEADTLIPVLCDQILAATETPPEDEVARSRAQLKASILMSLESTSSRCEQLARQWMIHGRSLSPEELVAGVEAVTPERVAAVAGRLFAHEPTLTLMGPMGRVESYDGVRHRLQA